MKVYNPDFKNVSDLLIKEYGLDAIKRWSNDINHIIANKFKAVIDAARE